MSERTYRAREYSRRVRRMRRQRREAGCQRAALGTAGALLLAAIWLLI